MVTSIVSQPRVEMGFVNCPQATYETHSTTGLALASPTPLPPRQVENISETLGFGLNVQLVFNSALNIVQLFTDAAVVTVVQHCYTLTHRSGVVVR